MKYQTYYKQADLMLKCYERFNRKIFKYDDVVLLTTHRADAIAISNSIKLGYMQRVDRGEYQFIKPMIALTRDQIAMSFRDLQRSRMNEYNKKRLSKKKVVNEFQSDNDDFTRKAIAHLKSLGYRILQPINDWKEL